MTFRLKTFALAAALAAAAGAACADDLKIALIRGLTGPLQAYAKQTETGFMLGLEYATKGTMMVDGRKIVVITKDDQSKPDLAKTALAEAYEDDGADIAVGTSSSAAAIAMLPVAEEHKKILVVEPAVADEITGSKWNRYIFRTARNSSQDAISNAVAIGKPGVHIATLAQDYAFGRDGVAAFKEALAKTGATLDAEEYAPISTTDFTAPAQRLFDALKDKPGRKIIWIIWAGGGDPLDKLADLDPGRYGIELSTGGNILPALAAYKRFPGPRGRNLLLLWHPQEPGERLARRRAREALPRPAGLLHRRRLRRRDGGGDRGREGEVDRHGEAHLDHGGHVVRYAQGQDDLPQGGPSGAAVDVRLQDQGRSERRLGHPRAHPRAQDRGHGHPDPQQAMTPSLETRNLTVRFGGHVAVDHVSCAFRPGELTAIVGPNGAGKTTYFNLMSGQLAATDGAVLIEGEDVTRLSAPQRTRRGLGRAFQLTNLFPRLSVAENVRLAVQARAGVHYDMRQPWRARMDLILRADAVLDSVGLIGKRDALASALPHGDQRKLEVAMMMALEPKIFMFDEPTAGMSVDEVPVVLDLIARLKTDGTKTILLVEHKMDVVRSLADRIIVLTNGQLAADGDPATVIASPVVQEAYLGIAPEKAA